VATTESSPTAREPRWLSADEQLSWRAWVMMSILLPERLEHDLKNTHGLSGQEYEVMVRLSEAPDRRLRMSELAGRTMASKSRLSHQISRMESDGLVRREECSTDRRGQFAVLTEEGWQKLVAAAPDHVESVRTWLLDALSDEEFATLGDIAGKVVERLKAECAAADSAATTDSPAPASPAS
jgi:DNA-binding MarR family transcriptional regulator